MGRIGCAFVPRFELAIRARADPSLWEQPVASVDWASRPPRILCASPAAEQLGVRVGQIASRVRSRLPELTCFAPDPSLIGGTEREVLGKLATVAPRLDSDGRGAFFLGLEGMERLWPDDRCLLERLSALFAELRLPARIRIAASPFAAWVGAVWAKGADQTPLDQVPLSELDLGESARELCALLGLRTAGALTRLPPGTLAARLGAEGARLERLCRGEQFPLWPTVQKLPRTAETVELDLEPALEGLEPLLFTLQALLDRLLAAVAAERQALVELSVRVRLDDRSEHLERFVPQAPTLQVPIWLDLLRLWLERRPFGAPVARLQLTASKIGPASQSQLSLLRQQEEQAAAAWGQAVARLSAAFGSQAIVRPVLRNTYRPEARLEWFPASALSANSSPAAPRQAFAPLSLALRQLEPPEPVVLCPGPSLRREGGAPVRIVGLDGPQRLSGEWWGRPFDRSYSWLRLASGELCWVFREEPGGRLYLQAVGD